MLNKFLTFGSVIGLLVGIVAVYIIAAAIEIVCFGQRALRSVGLIVGLIVYHVLMFNDVSAKQVRQWQRECLMQLYSTSWVQWLTAILRTGIQWLASIILGTLSVMTILAAAMAINIAGIFNPKRR